jgi:NTP-dependent ternary conflict system VMAP-like protein/SIR2-like protein
MFQPPQSLVDAVRDRTLVPFVGAGISVGVVRHLAADAQFPDWQGLIRRLAARLRDEQKGVIATQVEATLPDTMAAAQLAVDNLGRPLFLREMVGAFGRQRPPVGADLSTAHALWRLRSPFVITTNYDLVLEWPWDPTQVQRIHNDDPTYLGALDDTTFPMRRVWHLHGSIGRVDTLILTTDQYLRLYPDGHKARTDYQNAFNRLQQLLTTRSFLFLGFSLTEPVLRRKLQDVLDLTAHAAPIKFLLLRSGEADAAKQQEFFDRYHVQVLEFENFGGPLTAAIDAIGQAAWGDSPTVIGADVTSEMTPLVTRLLDGVSGLVLRPEVVARIYNAAKPQAWPYAPTGGDGVTQLRDAIIQLGGALSPGHDGVPPLLDFVDRLRAEVGEPWLTRLGAWLDDAIERVAADPDSRARLVNELATARATEAVLPVHVLLRIRAVAGASPEWLVHAWSWSGTSVPESLFGVEGRRFKEGSSGEVVYALVDELEARNVDPELTTIAFMVPSALACDAIHDWRLPASVANDPPIGATYTVIVRPLERLDRAPLIRRRFKKAWDEFKRRASEMFAVLDPHAPPPPGGVGAIVLDAATAMRRDLAITLEKQGVRCVVLREPPSATALAHLSAVLDTTTPAILWCQEVAAGPDGVESAIRDLLQSAPIAALPRRIRDRRAAAFRGEAGSPGGMNVTLVWDDADYLPPEHDANARAQIEIT